MRIDVGHTPSGDWDLAAVSVNDQCVIHTRLEAVVHNHQRHTTHVSFTQIKNLRYMRHSQSPTRHLHATRDLHSHKSIVRDTPLIHNYQTLFTRRKYPSITRRKYPSITRTRRSPASLHPCICHTRDVQPN